MSSNCIAIVHKSTKYNYSFFNNMCFSNTILITLIKKKHVILSSMFKRHMLLSETAELKEFLQSNLKEIYSLFFLSTLT
jgi:hypothetical protein